MKRIAALLLATSVAFSSFAGSWQQLGTAKVAVVEVRDLNKDKHSIISAELKATYAVKITAYGEQVSYSVVKVSLNCWSRETTIVSDSHFTFSGKAIPKMTNRWAGQDVRLIRTAGDILLNKNCPIKRLT